jgi:hypothetical protein
MIACSKSSRSSSTLDAAERIPPSPIDCLTTKLSAADEPQQHQQQLQEQQHPASAEAAVEDCFLPSQAVEPTNYFLIGLIS